MTTPTFNWENDAFNQPAATSAAVATGGKTITVGDLLIAIVAVIGTGTPGIDPGSITPPAGWSVIDPGSMIGNSFATPSDGSGIRIAAFSRVADGTEGSSFTFGWTTSAAWSYALLNYKQTNSASLFDGGAETDHNSGYGTTFVAPAITTTIANDLEIFVWSSLVGGTTTMPGGVNSRVNQTAGTTTAPWLGVADLVLGASGSQATQTLTYQFSTDGYMAFSFALRPSAGGGGASPNMRTLMGVGG